MLLLQNIQLFLQKAPDCDVRRHVLPLIYNSLSNENPKIQVGVLLFKREFKLFLGIMPVDHSNYWQAGG